MEHRWGHRRGTNRFVRLSVRSGLTGFGRIHNVSISGAWIVTGLPGKLLSCVEIGVTAIQKGRKTAAQVEGLIVRITSHGFGVEWCVFAHPAVLAILMVRPYRSARQARARAHRRNPVKQGRAVRAIELGAPEAPWLPARSLRFTLRAMAQPSHREAHDGLVCDAGKESAHGETEEGWRNGPV